MALFNKDQKVAAAPKKAAKAETVTVALDGLEQYAAMDMLVKALKTVTETLSGQLKDKINGHFVTVGMSLAQRPENYKAEEGDATASIQLKNRSTASVLDEDAQAKLTEAKIPFKTIDAVTETFILNPKYMEDAALMEKVEAALEGVVPSDFFLHQSQKKVVIDGDNTVNAVFKLKNKALVEELLPLVTTMAIKPTTKASISEAFELVKGMLDE